MLEKIFGKGSFSRTIGTRTNVVRFPRGQIVDDLDTTKSEYNIEKAAEKKSMAYQVVKKDIEDRMGDITKMNDAELLNYTANVRRMMNVEFPPPLPEADIVKFGSGQEIKGKGLEELIEKQGIKNPPTTTAGQLETTGKRLEQLGKDFSKEFDVENIAKQEADRQAMIARQYEGKGYAGGVFGPSGTYRAVARDFLLDQHAKGKIKLDADTLKNLEERNYISGGQPLMYADPIRILRYHYGDDVFEKIPLDKIPTGARSEIIDVMSKVEAPPIKTEAPKTPGGYLTPGEYRANIEEMQKIEDMIKRRESRFADMTEEEIQNELAQYGGKRSSFEMGLEFDYPEEYAKYKTPKKPEPEEKADGGRIGYAKGKRVKSSIDKLLVNLNKKTQGKKSMESVNPKTGEVTVPKKPIKRAEEPTGMTTMDVEPEIVDERSIKKTKSIMTIDDLKTKHKDAFEAHDQIFNVDINDKIAPDMIAESMAEKKGKDYFNLSQEEQSNLYKKALAYVDDVRMTKRQNKPIEGGFSFNDPDIKAQMEEAMTVAKKRGDEMRAMGLDPAKSRDYDQYIEIKTKSGDKDFNKYFDDLEIKTKFKGVISDDLLNQILIDDNPQRKAEVIATIEQGLTMQEKGMSPEQIVDILKNTTRTKQAKGGSIGLNYLMGF
jgi:hypothetical protein